MNGPSRQRANDDLPPGAVRFGLKIFLLSLGMLFASSLVAYAMIRHAAWRGGLSYGTLNLPVSLWASTAVMIASSLAIQRASRTLRQGRQAAFRRAIVAAAGLGLLFLVIQVPSLHVLLQRHAVFRAQNVFLYGLILVLIALHAAHVVGGLVPLGIVTGRALRGWYDARHAEGVRSCALYWHFLDVVWLTMFGLLYLTG